MVFQKANSSSGIVECLINESVGYLPVSKYLALVAQPPRTRGALT